MRPAPESVNARVRQAVDDLKRYGAETVILFGSAARGDMDEYSDLDFIVVKPTTMSFVARLADVVRQCPNVRCADVIVYTPEEFRRMREAENPFLEQAMSEGKILYEKA